MNNIAFAPLVSLICDCLLAALKLAAGIAASSHALVSDAVHSCADVFSCLIVLFGVSAKKSKNPKIRLLSDSVEAAALFALSIMLLLTGVGIGISAFRSLLASKGSSSPPEVCALAVAFFSLIVKELLFIYNIRVSKKTNSSLIRANAWHHQSDALSCLGSFMGILGARSGFPSLDAVASIIISILIIRVGVKIITETVKK